MWSVMLGAIRTLQLGSFILLVGVAFAIALLGVVILSVSDYPAKEQSWAVVALFASWVAVGEILTFAILKISLVVLRRLRAVVVALNIDTDIPATPKAVPRFIIGAFSVAFILSFFFLRVGLSVLTASIVLHFANLTPLPLSGWVSSVGVITVVISIFIIVIYYGAAFTMEHLGQSLVSKKPERSNKFVHLLLEVPVFILKMIGTMKPYSLLTERTVR